MSQVFLLLGSNQGDRMFYLNEAIVQIAEHLGKIKKKSCIYESQAWGYESQNIFYNQALLLETEFTPDETLNKIQQIEIILGRKRESEHYSDRTIDIDIIFFDKNIIASQTLIIPHPQLHKRRFALVPLAEIDEFFIHPQFNKSLRKLLDECEDKSTITIHC